MTPARTDVVATEIMAEESFERESTGLEETTNTESSGPLDFHSEINTINLETVESDKSRLIGGTLTNSEINQRLEFEFSELSEMNLSTTAKYRGVEISELTELTTVEPAGSFDTFESELMFSDKFTDLPISMTKQIELQPREGGEYVGSLDTDGTVSTEITRNDDLVNLLHLKHRGTSNASVESLEPIEVSGSKTVAIKSVKLESTTSGDLNDRFESERFISLGHMTTRRHTSH